MKSRYQNSFDVFNNENKALHFNDRNFNYYPMLLHRKINDFDEFSNNER